MDEIRHYLKGLGKLGLRSAGALTRPRSARLETEPHRTQAPNTCLHHTWALPSSLTHPALQNPWAGSSSVPLIILRLRLL